MTENKRKKIKEHNGQRERVVVGRHHIIGRPTSAPSARLCLNCRSTLSSVDNVMTAYPIRDVFVCPTCNDRYLLLYDDVLCSEKEFDERISEHYV